MSSVTKIFYLADKDILRFESEQSANGRDDKDISVVLAYDPANSTIHFNLEHEELPVSTVDMTYDCKNMCVVDGELEVMYYKGSAYAVCIAGIDIASFSGESTLEFTLAQTGNKGAPENWQENCNKALQIAFGLWEKTLQEAVGCGLEELGFISWNS